MGGSSAYGVDGPHGAPSESENLYALAELEADAPAAVVTPTVVERPEAPDAGGSERVACPGCLKLLPANAKICVECGIDIRTGRAILTSQDSDPDSLYLKTEEVIRTLSWIIPFGIYPVASEALGTRKPYVVRALAALTVLISLWFFAYEYSNSLKMRQYKNLMLWCGHAEPPPEMLVDYYLHEPNYGDVDAWNARYRELQGKAPPRKARVRRATLIDVMPDVDAKVLAAAYKRLTPEQQCLGRFRASQLLSHVFLHGDKLHLAGNMLFLLVIGSRVNALIGNVATIILYPLLGVAAALLHMHMSATLPPHANLGASGAIMGLSGMYLVLLPVHKVHMVIWWRLPWIAVFRLAFKMFAVRGFLVVLLYIGFDVVATALGSDDNVAHWAHLGGFGAGIVAGLILLFSRLVNCRGGDIVSALLGRRAWALVGMPNRPHRALP
jgi:membrane associated rhomboid family serine protease